jgi:anti-anti-sigma factor
MSLMLLSHDHDVVRFGYDGSISFRDFAQGTQGMAQFLGDGGFGNRVLLNLEQADFIDSSGIAWLISCHKCFVESGGILVIHTIPPMVRQVLDLMGLQRILHLVKDEEAAQTLLSGGAAR